jgi:hypothetical protein
MWEKHPQISNELERAKLVSVSLLSVYSVRDKQPQLLIEWL